MIKQNWFIATIGVGILISVFWFIFINHEPADVSEMQMRIEEQEEQLIFFQQELGRLEGEVASLNGRLQEQQKQIQQQQGRIQRQQQRNAQQRRELQQLRKIAQLVSQQGRLIDRYQRAQDSRQEQDRFERSRLLRRVSRLESGYQPLPRLDLDRPVKSQSPNPTQTANRTIQSFTQQQPDASTSTSGVPRQQYHRHLSEADFRKQRSLRNLNRIETTRQRQADVMQRVRER